MLPAAFHVEGEAAVDLVIMGVALEAPRPEDRQHAVGEKGRIVRRGRDADRADEAKQQQARHESGRGTTHGRSNL
jgi:hypothetical protein